MCAPILPLLTTIGGIATAASSLGVFGGRNNNNQSARLNTPPPTKAPDPAATGSGDDVAAKKPDESIKIQQNAKQKRDKQTVKKGLGALGAAPAINTGMESTPPGSINTGL
tara:strand:+ start:177 stop:509 length:333 start_codon:yes stop_codon:yes gene_type:complete